MCDVIDAHVWPASFATLYEWWSISAKEIYNSWLFCEKRPATYKALHASLPPCMNDAGQTCRAWEWVMAHMWVSHVAHVNESCRTCEWVMSHMWMGHVAHVNESCRTCDWVMSHIWMGHVTHVDEACHTCEWVMSHMWLRHVTHVIESSHTYEWGTLHT